MVGKTLGHYEILEPLGAGGMGEVYRARDTHLERDVAIKVLPEDFASDQERLARFEREAKLLAQLNHANIATIHGLEDADGVRFIAMECIEGETLAERIGRSGCIEVEESLEIARQVSEALEAAHESGVVHRDLKPANIKVTPDGKVKVLDFGLAKAYEARGSSSDVSPDLSHSPTMAAATRTGVILGTAAYMSPEQARGKPVDKRADIWAFGCVLYEMLAGKRAFDGETVSDTMAAILKEDPDWNGLPAGLSWRARNVLVRCLQKDPRQRLRDIADARIELLAEDDEPGVVGLEGGRAAAPKRGLVRTAIPWAVAVAAVATAAYTMLAAGSRIETVDLRPIVRTEIVLPAEAPLAPPGEFFLSVPAKSFELSRDAGKLVYVALVDGRRELWIRDMRTGITSPLPRTQDASWPFFSPGGDQIGFFADNQLKTMNVDGGGMRVIADAVWGHGGLWADDGWIYFAPTEGVGIARVSVSGGAGTVEALTIPNGPTWGHSAPKFLPGGAAILVGADTWLTPAVEFVRLDDPGSAVRLVPGMAAGARYTPSGHLVYGADGNVMAAPFDLDSLQLSGAAQVVLDDVQMGFHDIQASWADDGTLVYVPGSDLTVSKFEWIDRDGVRTDLGLPADRYGSFSLSPDGTRLAYIVKDDVDSELWLYDFRNSAPTPLTRGRVDDVPVWGPDGTSLFFQRVDDPPTLQRVDVDAPSAESEEVEAEQPLIEVSQILEDGLVYARDMKEIVFVPFEEGSTRLREEGSVTIVPESEGAQLFAALSPDRRWLVYTTAESGRWEVQVVSYPDGSGKRTISTGGGEEPRWNPTGGEIIYRNGARWYSVPFDGAAASGIPAPTEVLTGPFVNVSGYSWEITPDGQRFLVLASPEMAQPATRLVVISNFFDELERRAPTRR